MCTVTGGDTSQSGRIGVSTVVALDTLSPSAISVLQHSVGLVVGVCLLRGGNGTWRHLTNDTLVDNVVFRAEKSSWIIDSVWKSSSAKIS